MEQYDQEAEAWISVIFYLRWAGNGEDRSSAVGRHTTIEMLEES